MIPKIKIIGLGGGCHWCTEAVFQQLKGVSHVEQGYISSLPPNDSLSEAVIVHFNPDRIPLEILLEIHLRTHKSTSQHSMRSTYRSAIYIMDDKDSEMISNAFSIAKKAIAGDVITQLLPFTTFKASREEITNYYLKNPKKPFCERYIEPKLEMLRETYAHKMVIP